MKIKVLMALAVCRLWLSNVAMTSIRGRVVASREVNSRFILRTFSMR